MRKNNFWNRIFHASEVQRLQEKFEHIETQLQMGPSIMDSICNTKDLQSMLNLHKIIYPTFSLNIGPDKYGMFRCESISTMTPHQVYLGGIYGLNTCAIPYWEQYTNEPFGVNSFGIDEDESLYGIILDQYRHHLLANVRAEYEQAEKEYPEYVLCGY
jgi:hypothetical protein